MPKDVAFHFVLLAAGEVLKFSPTVDAQNIQDFIVKDSTFGVRVPLDICRLGLKLLADSGLIVTHDGEKYYRNEDFILRKITINWLNFGIEKEVSSYNVALWKWDDLWVGQCLEYDFAAAQGETIEHVLQLIDQLLIGQAYLDIDVDMEPLSELPPCSFLKLWEKKQTDENTFPNP